MPMIQVLDFESWKAAYLELPSLDEYSTEEEELAWRRLERFLYERYHRFLDNDGYGLVVDTQHQVRARPVFERRADGLYPVDLQNILNPAYSRPYPSEQPWAVEHNIIEPKIVESRAISGSKSAVVPTAAGAYTMSKGTAWASFIEVVLGFFTIAALNTNLSSSVAGPLSMLALFFWGTIVAQTVWMDLPKQRARRAARRRGEHVPSIGPAVLAATVAIAVAGHEYRRHQQQREQGGSDLRAMSAEYTRNVLGPNNQP